MSSTTQPQRNLYTTKEVAQILEIEDRRRVKNFGDIEDYGIKPLHVGSGIGSRKLYSTSQVYEIAIAEELSQCGFTSSSIGKALAEIRALADERIVGLREHLHDAPIDPTKPLLVYIKNWHMMSLSEFAKKCPKVPEGRGLFVLNCQAIVEGIAMRLPSPDKKGKR